VAAQLLGGWQANGVLISQTGLPIYPIQPTEPIADGCPRCNPRPDRLADGNLPSDQRSLQRWFDTSAFKVAVGHYGTSGRNIITAPGLTNLDFSLFKNFYISESKRVQFRWESYNATNTPYFKLNRGAQRGLRVLLRHLSEAPEEQRRLDVHQLPSDVGAWELLILALTVHLHQPDPWARANWCQDLVRRARDWQASGYAWLARQAWGLAELLNEAHFSAEMARLELPRPAPRGPREVAFWDLIAPKPEWQKGARGPGADLEHDDRTQRSGLSRAVVRRYAAR